MQILLTLEHSIDYSEAEGIVQDFLDQPWCVDATIVRSGHKEAPTENGSFPAPGKTGGKNG